MDDLKASGVLGPKGNINSTLLYAPLSVDLPTSGGTLEAASARLHEISVGSLLPVVEGTKLPSDDVLHSRIRNRTMLLDKETGGTTEKSKRASKRPRWALEGKGTGRRAIVSKAVTKRARSSKVDIPPDQRKYEIYEPLAKIWQDYAKQVVGDGNMTQAGDKLLRMDLHGATVEISRSLDPNLVGVAGILIVETANTILVVTRRNKIVTVAKNCAFIRFSVGDIHTFELALPMIPYRASERSARKVKKKHMSMF